MSERKHDAGREELLPGDFLPDQPMLEHDYDGIHEADNPLPGWWVNLFLVTVVFALVYTPVVHLFGLVPSEYLRRDMARAAQAAEQREAELIASGAYDKDPVGAGKKYFGIFCVSCHGSFGEGGIGPNLTDAYWIHGPRAEAIQRTIMEGVTAKGMPTWGPILGERKVKMITAYVLTLWNQELPAGVAGKKAEGERFDMAVIRAESAVTSDTTNAAAASDTSETM